MCNTTIKEGAFNATWESFIGLKTLKEHLQGGREEWASHAEVILAKAHGA